MNLAFKTKKANMEKNVRILVKTHLFYAFLFIQFFLFSIGCKKEIEKHPDLIIHAIRDNQAAIMNLKENDQPFCQNNCKFYAFWDFDGTLLDGDCTEGLTRNKQIIYNGLIAELAKAGLLDGIKNSDDLKQFWKDYRQKEKNDKIAAYVSLAQLLNGNSQDEVQIFAATYFRQTLSQHIFPSSVKVFKKLNEMKIEQHIISASSDVFVSGATAILPIQADHIHGIETSIVGGKMTNIAVQPITYAEGKTEKIQQILLRDRLKKPGLKQFILAGFGNSYHTDGPFLEYINDQQLPQGKSITVMINGGKTPKKYKKMFFEVSQKMN